MATFEFALVTPEAVLFDGETQMVSLRSAGGDIAFMAGHSPFIGNVEICVLKIVLPDNSVEMVAVDSGFVRVVNNKVTVCSPSASLGSDLSHHDVMEMKVDAERRISDQEGEDAEDDLRRAHIRLELLSQIA